MRAGKYFVFFSLLLSILIAGVTSCVTPALARHADNEGGYHPAVPTDIYSRLAFEGDSRKCLVHLPPSYDRSQSVPLVVVLHGGGGDIGFAVRMFQFNAKADKEGFAVAYPNGSGRFGDHVLTWNATACCGYAEAKHMDDVGFVRQFLLRVEHEYNIDKHRVYLVGFSNGAMMAYKLAAVMPEEFAAFAAVSGSMNGSEPKPDVPVSSLIVHGTADRHIPINGGGGKLAKWGFNVHALPLKYAESFWAKADGCTAERLSTANRGKVHIRHYLGGKDGSEVAVYVIDGYRHSWPGGQRAWFRADPPYPDLSATDLCWSFFSRHLRDNPGAKICTQPESSPMTANRLP